MCQRCDKNLRIFIHECGTPQEDDWTCVVGGWEDIALQDSATEVQDAAAAAAAAAKSLQLCLTLWDPIDGSPPGSPVPGILQARTLEWVAISFSNAWKWKVKVKSVVSDS